MRKVACYYVWDGTKEELNLLKLSLKTMLSYEWIEDIFILHPRLESKWPYGVFPGKINDPRIKWIGDKLYEGAPEQEAGNHFTPITQGGWNEVVTRNDGIKMCEESGADWIMQCDCDEFWTPQTYGLLAWADENKYDMLAVPNCHFINTTQIKLEPRCRMLPPKEHFHPVEQFGEGSLDCIYDPHVRLWRASMKLRYQYHAAPQDWEYQNKTFRNVSNHCGFPLPYHPEYMNGFYQCHIHDAIGHKIRGLDPNFTIIDAPKGTMPLHYIEAWEKQFRRNDNEISN